MEQTESKNKWGILLIVLLSTFMSTLDSSIVNVALPKMARELNVTTSSIQMVAISYLIVISGMVLIFGRLGDMYGKTKLFHFGLALFTFGSLLCGVADSFLFLIIARAIQAAGAAGTMANSQGIITEVFPAAERGRALGLSGTAVALGALVGPGLGGLIVGVSRWEFIFLINVPIGFFSFLLGLKLLPKDHGGSRGSLDVAGSILFALTIIPLFTALSEGVRLGFANPLILIGFTVSIVSFILFFSLEKRREHPLIKLEIFENKLFSLSVFCAFLTFVGMFCSNIILPFYLQDVLAYSPQHAGLVLMVYPLVLSVVAPVSGHLSDHIGSELLTFIGLIITSFALFSMSLLAEQSPVYHIVISVATMSVGTGLFQSPNNSLIMSIVPRHQLGIAGSINALVRNIGMVTGIALSTTLLYTLMSLRLGYHVTDYVVGRNDAFIYGMSAVYYVASAIILLGAILTLIRLLKKEKMPKTEQ